MLLVNGGGRILTQIAKLPNLHCNCYPMVYCSSSPRDEGRVLGGEAGQVSKIYKGHLKNMDLVCISSSFLSTPSPPFMLLAPAYTFSFKLYSLPSRKPSLTPLGLIKYYCYLFIKFFIPFIFLANSTYTLRLITNVISENLSLILFQTDFTAATFIPFTLSCSMAVPSPILIFYSQGSKLAPRLHYHQHVNHDMEPILNKCFLTKILVVGSVVVIMNEYLMFAKNKGDYFNKVLLIFLSAQQGVL